ncbi:hypothetical protein LBMAG42_20690 [Deltaproteobacteria bacterium]|nr:hypothetical protein LBMAG42_20690 [Deltaproteobacteria bacterium]
MARALGLCGVPLSAAAFTVWWHARWLAEDGGLPVGDAGGHLANAARHLLWLRGGHLPIEAFPPGLYVTSAFIIKAFGPTVDHVTMGTVAFAALLASVASWLGLRASGWTAGVVLPLALLSAPMLSGAARQVLLDVPATAAIAAIWVLAWESRGFRYVVPTLLLGVVLGLGALVKYTLFIWVLPALVLTGAWMVVRAPTSILPLLLVAWPAREVAQALQFRAASPQGGPLDLATYGRVFSELGTFAGIAAAGLAAAAYLRRRRPGWAAAGLTDGAGLALAALLALLVIFPWFYQAMPVVWEKVQREAITEVRSSGVGPATRFARAMVLRSWPQTWSLVQAAVGLECAWLLFVAYRKVSAWRQANSSATGRDPDPRGSPSEGTTPPPRFGPALPVIASCAFGTLYTARNLPVDTRYYLPLLVGVALLLPLAATRFRLGRWALGPLLGGVFLWQLAADRGIGPKPVRLESTSFSAQTALAMAPQGPFAPPLPKAAPFVVALEVLVAAIVGERVNDAGAFFIVVPPFAEARSLGLESRTLQALAQLGGVQEPALRVVEVEGGGVIDPGNARYLAIAGGRPSGLSALVEGWDVVTEAQVGDRRVALYRRPR